MNVLAIDPGNIQSQYLVLGDSGVIEQRLLPNPDLLADLPRILETYYPAACIEGVQCFGMIVGQEVFDTAWWGGRFQQQCAVRRVNVSIVFRKTVKLHLCGNPRAKDSNIRQALIDSFGGKVAAIGNKREQGPIYGVHQHGWSALALAVTFRYSLKAAPATQPTSA